MYYSIEKIEQIFPAKRRPIKMLVLHCSDTEVSKRYSASQLANDSLLPEYDERFQPFLEEEQREQQDGVEGDILPFARGYHYYITYDGELYAMNHPDTICLHTTRYNYESLAICYEGGRNAKGEQCDTRSSAQRQTMTILLMRLRQLYPSLRLTDQESLPDRAFVPHKGCYQQNNLNNSCSRFDMRWLANTTPRTLIQ